MLQREAARSGRTRRHFVKTRGRPVRCRRPLDREESEADTGEPYGRGRCGGDHDRRSSSGLLPPDRLAKVLRGADGFGVGSCRLAAERGSQRYSELRSLRLLVRDASGLSVADLREEKNRFYDALIAASGTDLGECLRVQAALALRAIPFRPGERRLLETPPLLRRSKRAMPRPRREPRSSVSAAAESRAALNRRNRRYRLPFDVRTALLSAGCREIDLFYAHARCVATPPGFRRAGSARVLASPDISLPGSEPRALWWRTAVRSSRRP